MNDSCKEQTEVKAILVGKSPAICVCAIYLHTANIKPVVIWAGEEMHFSVNVPGVENTEKEFKENCFLQIKNMGVKIIADEKIKVEKNGDTFSVEFEDKIIKSKVLVSDFRIGNFEASDFCHVVSERLQKLDEAILLSGEGCKIAFDIKDKCFN